MSMSQYYRNLVEGRRRGLDSLVLLPLLWVFSIPYGLVMGLRAICYRIGLFRVNFLPRPVVSIGNLTVGGTGKTPVVALIAHYYLEKGKRVAVLSRGYGGKSEGSIGIVSDGSTLFMTAGEAGDEPFMLAEKIPGLIVVVGADRYRAALHVIEKLNPDLFILDDGFQHLRLHRDLNILLLDHRRSFGNGRVFPGGLLREPTSAANRADFIIYTRCGGDQTDGPSSIPFCNSTHKLSGVVSSVGGKIDPLSSLAGLRGVAFAGIAEPQSFFSMLDMAGLNIVSRIALPDHCGYENSELIEIKNSFEKVDADFLITTEKDLVKVTTKRGELGRVHAAVLELEITDKAVLNRMLDKLL